MFGFYPQRGMRRAKESGSKSRCQSYHVGNWRKQCRACHDDDKDPRARSRSKSPSARAGSWCDEPCHQGKGRLYRRDAFRSSGYAICDIAPFKAVREIQWIPEQLQDSCLRRRTCARRGQYDHQARRPLSVQEDRENRYRSCSRWEQEQEKKQRCRPYLVFWGC